MKNISLSYSNSPVYKFIGSQIYKLVGLAVHIRFLEPKMKQMVLVWICMKL